VLLRQHNLEVSFAQGVQDDRVGRTIGDEEINLVNAAEIGQFYSANLGTVRDNNALAACLQHAPLDLGFGQVNVGNASSGVDAIAAEKNGTRIDAFEHQAAQGVDERVLHGPQRAPRDNDRKTGNCGLKLKGDIEGIREDNDVV